MAKEVPNFSPYPYFPVFPTTTPPSHDFGLGPRKVQKTLFFKGNTMVKRGVKTKFLISELATSYKRPELLKIESLEI